MIFFTNVICCSNIENFRRHAFQVPVLIEVIGILLALFTGLPSVAVTRGQQAGHQVVGARRAPLGQQGFVDGFVISISRPLMRDIVHPIGKHTQHERLSAAVPLFVLDYQLMPANKRRMGEIALMDDGRLPTQNRHCAHHVSIGLDVVILLASVITYGFSQTVKLPRPKKQLPNAY